MAHRHRHIGTRENIRSFQCPATGSSHAGRHLTVTPEKLTEIFNSLAWGGHPRAFTTIAAQAGATVAEVHLVIALVKQLQRFIFTLTKAGRLKNLQIISQARGFYGEAYLLDGDDVFFKDGVLVARFGEGQFHNTAPFSARLQSEAKADGFPYIPRNNRIAALAPYLAQKMAELGCIPAQQAPSAG